MILFAPLPVQFSNVGMVLWSFFICTDSMVVRFFINWSCFLCVSIFSIPVLCWHCELSSESSKVWCLCRAVHVHVTGLLRFPWWPSGFTLCSLHCFLHMSGAIRLNWNAESTCWFSLGKFGLTDDIPVTSWKDMNVVFHSAEPLPFVYPGKWCKPLWEKLMGIRRDCPYINI